MRIWSSLSTSDSEESVWGVLFSNEGSITLAEAVDGYSCCPFGGVERLSECGIVDIASACSEGVFENLEIRAGFFFQLNDGDVKQGESPASVKEFFRREILLGGGEGFGSGRVEFGKVNAPTSFSGIFAMPFVDEVAFESGDKKGAEAAF